jgi:tRNA threonylcarbamoyladenosine biosynthesis protein TsaE
MQQVFELADIQKVAANIVAKMQTHGIKCIALHGEMGAGKTTLTASICMALGVNAQSSSPTFSIVNEYVGFINQAKIKIAHMDWYRLASTDDIYSNGLDEYLSEENTYCIVEWPEIAKEVLPVHTMHVYLSLVSQEQRRLEIKMP